MIWLWVLIAILVIGVVFAEQHQFDLGLLLALVSGFWLALTVEQIRRDR